MTKHDLKILAKLRREDEIRSGLKFSAGYTEKNKRQKNRSERQNWKRKLRG